MKSSLAAQALRFSPAIFLVSVALWIFDRATASLDRVDLLAYGYETATFGLFAARGTGTALTVFAAGWLIWGAGKLVARLAVSLTILATVVVCWHRLCDPETPWSVLSQHASTFITFVGSGVVLASAGRCGLSFVGTVAHTGCNLQKWQVSILDLLAMMSGAAILLAITRGYVPHDFSNWRLSQDEVLWVALQAATNLLIVASIVTCFHQRRAWWLNLMTAAGLSAAAAAIHIAAISCLLELPLFPLDSALMARGIHHGVNFVWLVCSLEALRLAGYRLNRVPQNVEASRIEVALEPSVAA